MRKVIFLFSIFMFFFKTSATANYEKKFYDFTIESITGETINLNDYKDKVILVVNTASFCGFTKQYDELQELSDLYKEKGLVVLGVPSNSFNQEKKNDADVKKFCEVKWSLILVKSLFELNIEECLNWFPLDLVDWYLPRDL